VEGFAKSLEEFDAALGDFLRLLKPDDLLIITADHGCDPDPRWETTDHSREYVPILAYSPSMAPNPADPPAKTASQPAAAGTTKSPARNLGTRSTLADMGQTIAENFGTKIPHGTTFLEHLR
jgi:phosphopentomutase